MRKRKGRRIEGTVYALKHSSETVILQWQAKSRCICLSEVDKDVNNVLPRLEWVSCLPIAAMVVRRGTVYVEFWECFGTTITIKISKPKGKSNALAAENTFCFLCPMLKNKRTQLVLLSELSYIYLHYLLLFLLILLSLKSGLLDRSLDSAQFC